MLIKDMRAFASNRINNLVYAEIYTRGENLVAQVAVELDGKRHASEIVFSRIHARSYKYGDVAFYEMQVLITIENLERYLKEIYGLPKTERNRRTNSDTYIQR